MGFKMTLQGALMLIDSEAREYRVAYATGNGEWDVVDRFLALSDDSANAYAERYFHGDEWYVLDSTGKNINGGGSRMTIEKLNPRDAWLVDRSGKSCCYLVKDGGHIYGLLEKEPGRGQPWKAFHGTGRESKYLGSSYTGREAAVEMVMQAVRERQAVRS